MSLQALCDRSMRTGVRSRSIGNGPSGCGSAQQFGTQPQRMVGGMAETEHPLVAAHLADAAAHLVGERLKGQCAIGRRQGAGQGVAWPVRRLLGQEELYRLIEAAQQQTAIALERHSAARRQIGTERQMVAVDRGEKEQGAHALVEVAGFLTKNVQIGTFVE